MFPYIWAQAQAANQTGAPLIQHLFLRHPEARFAGVEDAHYFGSSLLVAPVVARGARQKSLTLPDGKWLEWQPDGALQIVSGDVTLDAPLTKLPLLLRDGGLLPLYDPSIETLVDTPAGDPKPLGIIGPRDVAAVYDVVGFVTVATGAAQFSLADGDLTVTWKGGFDASQLTSGDPATCEGCYLKSDLAGATRVQISSSSAVQAGGLSLQSTTGRRIRWDLYLAD
jgi:hypothetical protein